MHRPGGGFPVGGAVHGADVELVTESQLPHRPAVLVRVGDQLDRGGCGGDGVPQLFDGDRYGWGGVVVAGSVEADEGVVVHDAAALKLSDLGEGHHHLLIEP